MKIDIATSRLPPEYGPEIVDCGQGASRVLAILDGSGAWDAGAEAAAGVAKLLRSRWATTVPESPGELMEHVAEVSAGESRTNDDILGRPGFSLSAVIVRNAEAFVISCGSYTVLHVLDGRVDVLYRPLFWVDEQVRLGTLTAAEAKRHPLRHVYVGPLVSNGKPADWACTEALRAGMVLVVTMELARHLLALPVAAWSQESAVSIQSLENDAATQMRPVIRVALAQGTTS